MEQALTYTFKFGLRGKSMSIPDHVTTQHVALEGLLERFDDAYDWVMTNPDLRYAEVYGPGMSNRVVCEGTREYIVDRLPEELIKKNRRYIGLGWIDRGGDRSVGAYRLYKIWNADKPSLKAPGTWTTCYGLMDVDPEDWELAFDWARVHRWFDYGIWFRNKPGLVFCPDFDAVSEAFAQIDGVAEHLEAAKLERAPVRYGWDVREDAYPRMRPTRSTPSIHKLRARYPTAGEDLKVTPLSILIHRYGYSKAAV
jgi:hypothetical protein